MNNLLCVTCYSVEDYSFLSPILTNFSRMVLRDQSFMDLGNANLTAIVAAQEGKSNAFPEDSLVTHRDPAAACGSRADETASASTVSPHDRPASLQLRVHCSDHHHP